MPKPSLTQKLGKKPSRSYLSGLGDAGGDGGSVASFRSGEDSSYSRTGRGGGAGGGRTASIDERMSEAGNNGYAGSRSRYNSMPSASAIAKPRGPAASDIGMSYAPTSRLRTLSGATQDRFSGGKRRSVTFGDLNTNLFDDRDRLEVMSDVGGYGQSHRRRAPSMTSSIMSGDVGSDAGSIISSSGRRSIRRGSRSEKVMRTSQSMDLWHNNLGGPGLVRRSDASGTVISTSNPLSSIVQRKSGGFGSSSKFLESEPQPSRRYSMQPAASTDGEANPVGSTSASNMAVVGKKPTDSLQLPKADGKTSPSSSANSSPAGSEASFALRTKVHSRHSQKQRAKSGLDPLSQSGTSAAPTSASSGAPELKRSASTSSTGSKKSSKGTSKASQPSLLHSTTLKNNLINMPAAPPSPTKRKRTPEQVVEALAKAGLLDRVMEAVQEADEEESGASGAEEATPKKNSPRIPEAISAPTVAPTPQHVTAAPSVPVPSTITHEHEPTREELVQTPASEFATPPSTPPMAATPLADERQTLPPADSLTNGFDTADGTATPVARAPSPQQPATTQQTDIVIPVGTSPVPVLGSGPPMRLESLSALSKFGPHLISQSLEGTILVLAMHNLVMVFARLTWNNWANYEEVAATPAPEVAGTPLDLKRYNFTWSLPPGTNGAEVQLALRMEDGQTGQAHWDNNDGRNYTARLSSVQKREPRAEPSPKLNGDVVATPAVEQASAVPPRVFLVRTTSDTADGPDVLYDPNRRSLVLDGQAPDVEGKLVPASAIPFPITGHPQQHTSETASTGSSYSVPTPTASIKDDMAPNAHPSPIPKHVLASGVADAPMQNASAPSSRAHSTSSHASGDSVNAPFHYPSSRAYQTTAIRNQGSLRRRASRESHNQHDMPSIMTAFQPSKNGPDDLAGIYTSSSQGASPTQSLAQNASVHPSRSPSNAGSVGARSNGGMSSMALPSARPFNSKAEPKPFSMSSLTSGAVILPTSNSTMRALTLTSNAAQTLSRSFWRNNTQKPLRQDPRIPDHLNGKLGSAANMTFSNLTPVPHKIRSDECLVQVFACAIDFWDRAKVEILHARGQGYGFIPGRAFVGKVLETGSDVDPSKTKKGDFVYGLADLRKSGALAEYVSVQRNTLSQAPNGVLSLEQIAAVSLSGIAAYQAMDELCSTLPRGSKVIILNAHEGVGALALQLGQALRPAGDLWMLGHYPADFADGDSILRALGASETLCGEPISAIQSLRESTYDAMLDPIGGRKIYDASKRVLHDDGYFVTTVGDALSVPTNKATWKKSLKALFKSRDKKNIMYWFPSVESDSRASLVRLREIAEAGQIKPVVKRVYKFEEGSKAFQGASEQAVIMLLDQEKLANGQAA